MTHQKHYVKIVEWSEEDACYIGSCPELFYGGCHGQDPRIVFDELCRLVDEILELYGREGKQLPEPMSGRDFINAMQKIA